MKMIKMALLGGAALAVSAMAAQADDLDALKAQIESLNARVAAMEAAPSVPAGYNLLTLSEGPAAKDPFGNAKEDVGFLPTSHKISILPTADVPAAATIDWSGYVYAIVGYADFGDDVSSTDVFTRAQLKVIAKNDTAVGEVGVEVRLRADNTVLATGADGQLVDHKDYFKSPKYWGWWSMTPELTFGGGYAGSQGATGFGVDAACTCYWTDVSGAFSGNPGDTHQIALMYASGPISAAVALEDASGTNAFSGNTDDDLGVAGNVKFSSTRSPAVSSPAGVPAAIIKTTLIGLMAASAST